MTMRKFPRTILAASLAAAALLAAAPASAQRQSLAERVASLEQQAGNNQVTVDLLRQVALLKDEVTALRSQIEQLTHEQEQARQSNRAQYLDLDGRLNRLEGNDGAPPLGAEMPAASTPGAGSAQTVGSANASPAVYGDAGALDLMEGERETYDAAFSALKAGQYDESARRFNSFLGHYPNGVYAPNALYWLGESYYVTQNYKLALTQFRSLLQRYPTHDKAPGAMLKVGLSQQGLGQNDEAERTLAEVSERYPGTDAARVAADRLGAIQLGRLR